MVMEVTGHRSLEGIRSYKRTSTRQQEVLSDIINSASPEEKSSGETVPSKSTAQNHHKQLPPSSSPIQQIELSHGSVNPTNIHTVSTISQNTLSGHVFNFNSCSCHI